MATVRILHEDYSKYGTSVYFKLYGENRNKGHAVYDDQGNNDIFRKGYRGIITAPRQKPKRGKLLQNLFPTEAKVGPDFSDINSLPDELICRIIDSLGDKNSELSCLYVSKKWYACAITIVYRSVRFSSTYRVAQFVTTLRENPEYGYLVKDIDLSQMKNGLLYSAEEGHNEYEDDIPSIAFAGWRDWRYRKSPLYGGINRTVTRSTNDDASIYSSVFSSTGYRTRSNSLSVKSMKLSKSLLESHNTKKGKGSKLISSFLNFFQKTCNPNKRRTSYSEAEQNLKKIQNTTVLEFIPGRSNIKPCKLPFTNKFLLKYAHLRDLPMGYVLHLLTLCVNLEKLNISNLTLSLDFEIEELHSEPSTYGRYSMVSDETFESENPEPIMDIDGSLPAIYFSDSDKPYHYYRSREDDWFSNKSQMFCIHHPKRKKFQLRPLSNNDLHQKIAKLTRLQSLVITNVVWLMQKDMQDLITILSTKLHLSNVNQIISIDFTGSGMQLHSPLSNRGDLPTMIALMILSQLSSASDEELVSWFNLQAVHGPSPLTLISDSSFSTWWDDSAMVLAIATHLSQSNCSNPTFCLDTVIFKESHFDQFKFTASTSVEKFSIVFEIGMSCTDPTHRPVLEHCSMLYDRIKRLRQAQLLQYAGENYRMLSLL